MCREEKGKQATPTPPGLKTSFLVSQNSLPPSACSDDTSLHSDPFPLEFLQAGRGQVNGVLCPLWRPKGVISWPPGAIFLCYLLIKAPVWFTSMIE